METIVTLTMNPCIDVSAHVPKIEPEKKLRCDSPVLHPGGGGINVSRVIHRLGGSASTIYPAGGVNGVLLAELLDQESLWHLSVSIQGLTRENYTFFDESSGLQYRFNTPGPKLSEKEWKKCLKVVSELSPTPDYIIASGSLPQGVPDDFFAKVAAISKKLDARVIVDTSGNALQHVVKEGGIYLIKPNRREFRELTGLSGDDEKTFLDAAEEIIKKGQCEVVIVSLGSDGLLAVWKDGHQRVHTPDIHAVSKVGAGDSTVAGLTLQLARGKTVADAAYYGAAAGNAAVMTPGTELCRKEDTERIYEEMVKKQNSEFRSQHSE